MADINDKINRLKKYLTSWERQVVDYLYGVNGKEKLSKKDIIVMFNMDKSEMIYLINKINSIVRNELKVYRAAPLVDEETYKLIEVMSSTFFDMFKDIDPFVVEKSFSILPYLNRKVLILFYGLDGVHCLDYDEVAAKYNMSVDEVDEIIEFSIKKLKKHFENNKNFDVKVFEDNVAVKKVKKKYVELEEKYGKEKVNEAMSKLNKDEKQVLTLYYGDNKTTIDEVAFSMNLTSAKVNAIKFKAFIKLRNLLNMDKQEDIQLVKSVGRKKINRYKLLEEKYGKEKVEKAFLKLNNDMQRMVDLYYRSDNKTYVEISNLLSVPWHTVEYNVMKSLKIIEDFVSNNFENEINIDVHFIKGKRKINKYDEIVEKYGKDRVEEASLKLTDDERKLVDMYYRSDKLVVAKEISRQTGFSVDIVYSVSHRCIKKIIDIIENPEKAEEKYSKFSFGSGKRGRNVINKYDQLVEKYGEKNVEEVFECCSDIERKVIELYYKSVESKSVRDIGEIIGESYQVVNNIVKKAVKRMTYLLDHPDMIGKKIRRGLKKGNEYKKLIEKYGEEKVNEAFLKLNERQQQVVDLYYKSDIGYSYEEISKKLNLSLYNTRYAGVRAIKNITYILENEISINRNEDRFNSLVGKYSREVVKLAINELSDAEKAFLIMYYNFKSDREYTISEICEKIKIHESQLSTLEEKILVKLSCLLEKNNINKKIK